ncbi:MAG: hypothetical protein OJF62_000048 [Pseudolabrys sp.]|jgi:hypothetical protein|nr:hypothetical protein [Pseudolabrys sp.]
MAYRVYSGPAGVSDVSLTRDNMLFKEFATLDEAFLFARHLERGGTTPLLIDGDDGTRMNKREIGEALRVGDRADVRSAR